jgi:hypothetical protein
VESCFENATEFIPERWGEKPEMVRDKQVFVPFSVGKFFALKILLIEAAKTDDDLRAV